MSPEGCASILWKSAEKAAEAAEAMKMTTTDLARHGLVDEVIDEPMGGAHRDYDEAAKRLSDAIASALDSLCAMDTEALVAARYQRLMQLGKFEEKAH